MKTITFEFFVLSVYSCSKSLNGSNCPSNFRVLEFINNLTTQLSSEKISKYATAWKVWFLLSVIHVYQIYVVKCFYDDELDHTLVTDLPDCAVASRCYVRPVDVSNASNATTGRRPVAVPSPVYRIVTGQLGDNRGYPTTTSTMPTTAPEQRPPDYEPPAYIATDSVRAQRT